MGGKTSAESKNKYNNKTYDRIVLLVKKGEKERIQKQATEKGKSLSKYITDLIPEVGDK